jgi:ATP-dependent helicase/nuclease subunit A
VTLADAEARRQISADFDTTLVVEAAAGTGKTTELVRRIAGLLREGVATLERVIAVTFTDKAAGEMKLRLRAEIERERHRADVTPTQQQRLERALEALETAHIGTIHAFCLDLLRERPVEAAVDPAFDIIAEPRPLLAKAFDRWYQAALDAPPEGLVRVLARRGWEHGQGPREMLLGAAEQLVERRDFDAPWSRPPFSRNDRIDALVAQVAELGAMAELASSPRDPLARGLTAMRDLASSVAERENARPRDHDRLEYELGQLARNRDAFGKKGRGKFFGRDVPRDDVLAARAGLQASLQQFVADADADLAACLQQTLGEVVAGYQELKAQAGALDYLDMLVCVRDMLRNDATIRAELQRRFSHLFVDEFQDTDPLQAEIILLIAADDPTCDRYVEARPIPGKLFVVGDPKQAIYRFRRADVVLYQRVKEQLVGAGAKVLYLTTSFRSLPAIQGAVNQAFEQAMAGDEAGAGWQADYVPLHRHRPARDRQPAVVALPIPDPYSSYGNLSNVAIRASEPEAIAGFVSWLVDRSGWRVERRREGRSEWVPLQARHVCLLFRGFHSYFAGDITRAYVRELEARKIPHVLVGGRAYHGREEVIALRAALAAIEWPHDELSVYATLRGPFFSFGDDVLLHYRRAHKQLQPLRLPDDDQGEVAQALALLAKLHRGRNRRPIPATMNELLAATRAHAAVAIWPTGEQALANILRALDEARRFEHGGGTSFRAFVEHLDDAARRGRGAEAPVVEEGTDGVRIMTVHGAKGLEFPVVVLCDMAKPRSSTRPSRHVDAASQLWAFPLAGCIPYELHENADEVIAQDEAESVRVTYVAATRARDLLVVPTVGDARRRGWVDPLHSAIYPAHDKIRDAVSAPGCPDFGRDSVRRRPTRAEASPEHSVMPGLHRGCAGGHGVVWWDPSTLPLDVAAVGGLRQTALLEQGDGVQPGGDAEYEAWRSRRVAANQSARQPTRAARPITTLAQEPSDETLPAPEVQQTDAPRGRRPRGPRFGTLVHAVLALARLDADRSQLEALAKSQSTLLGATEPERRAAVDAAEAALAHPLLEQARASPDCRREVGVTVALDDGRLAEGIVDLAFAVANEAGESSWLVVDFKTDASEDGFAVYARQLALYCLAITKATGLPARGLLLRV